MHETNKKSQISHKRDFEFMRIFWIRFIYD